MTEQSHLEHLIERCALGDRDAFDAVYDVTSAKLFGVLMRVLKDKPEAEEALQDVFIKVWHNADRYQSNGLRPMTWLITIARNHAIDLWRKKARTPQSAGASELELIPDRGPNAEGIVVAKSEAARISQCLNALDPSHSAAVRGAYLDGQTYADLADAANVPLNTMRTWLRRSLAKLKDCLSA